jgi:hypothetical protein
MCAEDLGIGTEPRPTSGKSDNQVDKNKQIEIIESSTREFPTNSQIQEVSLNDWIGFNERCLDSMLFQQFEFLVSSTNKIFNANDELLVPTRASRGYLPHGRVP